MKNKFALTIQTHYCAAVLQHLTKGELWPDGKECITYYISLLEDFQPERKEYFQKIKTLLTKQGDHLNRMACEGYAQLEPNEILGSLRPKDAAQIDVNNKAAILDLVHTRFFEVSRFYFSEFFVIDTGFENLYYDLKAVLNKLPTAEQEGIKKTIPFCFLDSNQLSLQDEILLWEKQSRLYEDLAQLYPQQYERRYLENLLQQAFHLSNNKEYQKAVQVGQEAIQVYKKIPAEKLSTADEEGYANLLLAMGYRYAQLKQQKECLEYSVQGCELYHQLITEKGLEFELEYADALDKTGLRFKQFKKTDEAVKYGTQSVELYRKIYSPDFKEDDRYDPAGTSEYDPHIVRPRIAFALCNLAETWKVKGKYEEVLKLEEEARKLFEVLYKEEPAKYMLSLAKCYDRMAILLQAKLKKPKEALIHAAQAMQFYRERMAFLEANPTGVGEATKPNAAILSMEAAQWCLTLDQYDQAENYIAESISIFVPLAQSDKSGYYYNGYLADARVVQSKVAAQLGQWDRAIHEAQEAVTLLEANVKKCPGYYIEELQDAKDTLDEWVKSRN